MEFYDRYRRFKHYHNTHGGVYIYPEYDEDLEAILEYISDDLMGFDGVYDCSWQPVEGEDDDESYC